jgi:hypothetical protein
MGAASQPTAGPRQVGARATRVLGARVGLTAILLATIIGIFFAPLGLEWVASFKRNWSVLGNVGQAYGGISALISAIALAGVVGSLLVQNRQHALDRITSVRGRQAQLYATVREDPGLYWPILGGDFISHSYSSVRRQTFRVEVLQHFSAGYETGLISEDSLRNEVFPQLFRYEEARQFWELSWSKSGTTRRGREFTRIGNEELSRVKKRGPGLVLEHTSGSERKFKSGPRSRRRQGAFLIAAVGLVLLLIRFVARKPR